MEKSIFSEAQALAALKQYYGYDSFRGLQQKAIESLMNGNDSMIIMPTGMGKSVCFQIPALLRNGFGIVVSPLIALMNDQVQSLNEMGIRAAALNSSMGVRATRAAFAAIKSGAPFCTVPGGADRATVLDILVRDGIYKDWMFLFMFSPRAGKW